MPYNTLFAALQQPQVYQATKYLSPTLVVKATRRRFGGKLLRRQRQETLLVTIGQPNWKERQFIKQCVKAKEPFPVKRIQVRHV